MPSAHRAPRHLIGPRSAGCRRTNRSKDHWLLSAVLAELVRVSPLFPAIQRLFIRASWFRLPTCVPQRALTSSKWQISCLLRRPRSQAVLRRSVSALFQPFFLQNCFKWSAKFSEFPPPVARCLELVLRVKCPNESRSQVNISHDDSNAISWIGIGHSVFDSFSPGFRWRSASRFLPSTGTYTPQFESFFRYAYALEKEKGERVYKNRKNASFDNISSVFTNNERRKNHVALV